LIHLLRPTQCIVIEPRSCYGAARRTDGQGSYVGYLSKDAIFSAYRKILVEQGSGLAVPVHPRRTLGNVILDGYQAWPETAWVVLEQCPCNPCGRSSHAIRSNMNYTENFEGIKLDVQAVDHEVEAGVQEQMRKMLSRLGRHFQGITHADVYLEDKAAKSNDPKQVSVRLGIPGNDPFASERGDNFMALLANVEEKLRRQLEKR
jgi:putative sigma-54 modulation protein